MIATPLAGWPAISFSSSASAGGQSEQPSDVNSSTRIGVGGAAWLSREANAGTRRTTPTMIPGASSRDDVRRIVRILGGKGRRGEKGQEGNLPIQPFSPSSLSRLSSPTCLPDLPDLPALPALPPYLPYLPY